MRKLVFAAIMLCGLSGLAAAQTQKIMLRSGQEKNILGSKLMIKFASVVEDSRCPVDKTCVWAGNAKVMIQLRKKGSGAKEFVLNSGIEPRTIQYRGYEIQLANLSPRPGENVKAMAAKNTAVFEVRKL